jgi:hypothetical protein
MRGVVVDVRATLVGERLKVSARIDTDGGGPVDAWLPDRETAALLPRTLLVGEQRRVPTRLLRTARPILRRFVVGRRVRLWEHEGINYFAFLSWRDVRFTDQELSERQPTAT